MIVFAEVYKISPRSPKVYILIQDNKSNKLVKKSANLIYKFVVYLSSWLVFLFNSVILYPNKLIIMNSSQINAIWIVGVLSATAMVSSSTLDVIFTIFVVHTSFLFNVINC